MKVAIISVLVIALYAISHANHWDHYAISPKLYEVEDNNSGDFKLNNTLRYCYHFTWMGINFNNRTFKNIQNKTCNQYFKDKKTLCINPMVATYAGGAPDLRYILDNHAKAATCRLLQEQICAKYTMYRNGIVSYATRYCTQINVDREGPMKKGCIQEKRGNDLIEVCACTSDPGPDGICNSGPKLYSDIIVLVIGLLVIKYVTETTVNVYI